MLRFLKAFALQDAFALLVDLEHVKLGLFPGPTENGLKNVRDIIHEIDRVVPAKNEIPGLKAGFWLFLCRLDGAWQHLWNGGLCHKGKLKEDGAVVEPAGKELNCYPCANPPKSGCWYRQFGRVGHKKSEDWGVQFVELVLL
jgi:hypothetical protein